MANEAEMRWRIKVRDKIRRENDVNVLLLFLNF